MEFERSRRNLLESEWLWRNLLGLERSLKNLPDF
jgi:hypothetical protein